MSVIKWGWNDTLELGYKGCMSFTFSESNGKNDILVAFLTLHFNGII